MLDLFASLRDGLRLTLVVATHDPLIAARAGRELRLIDGQFASASVLSVPHHSRTLPMEVRA